MGIEVRGLRVARGGRIVLREVSFEAPRGQVLALVGASGAGKSTLLRCLNRLTDPEAGTIALDGQDIRAVAPQRLRRRVALVAQAPAMLPGTVEENLAYGLARLTDATRDAALLASGLGASFLPRPAKALSGGERARVALARALTRDPDAILLDEPTASLDPDTAHVIAETVAALAGRDLAVIVATHDAALASSVADATLRLRPHDDTSPPAPAHRGEPPAASPCRGERAAPGDTSPRAAAPHHDAPPRGAEGGA